MTLFPEYAAELGQAGNRLASRRVRRRRRARITAIVAISLVALGAIAAGAATLWTPQLGDDHRGHPVPSRSAPPADQLKLFGVLRRDATSEDHGQEVLYALSMFTPKGITGVRTDYVRLLGTYDGKLGAVLVPAQTAGDKHDALCIWLRDPGNGGGWSCYTTAEILSGHGWVGMGGPKAGEPRPPGSQITAVGLVPDNVARVRSGQTEVTVTNNFFKIRVPAPTRETGPASIEWLDSAGKRLKQAKSPHSNPENPAP